MHQLTAPQLAAWLTDPDRPAPLLLDVREPWEFDTCKISGSTSMPMQNIVARHAELPQDTAIVCICHHGARSMQVAAFLERQGFTEVSNLQGGVHAWAQQVDPHMPIY